MFSRTVPSRYIADIPTTLRIALFSFTFCYLGISSDLRADTPPAQPADLTHRINQQYQSRSQLFQTLPVIDDATFARRVALDLTGMPLSKEQLQTFLKDNSPNKREILVEELLGTPQATRQLATWLSITLLERRNPKVTNDDLWMAYLMEIIRNDRPLSEMTAELLTATGQEGHKQAAARFLMDRDAEPNLMTRDAGRIFMGRDMQCAQCHDHPLVDGYLQTDYQSLLAFFQPTSVVAVKSGGKQINLLSEKTGGRILFDSVFVKDDSQLTGPRIPGGLSLSESSVKPGEEYQHRQSETKPSVVTLSRRKLLSDTLIGSPLFAQNWANRIWLLAFGRGIVNPPDFMHPENPPVDEKLLSILSEEFQKNGYRIRPLLKAIVLSIPYQSPFEMNAVLAGSLPAGDLEEMKSTVNQLETDLEGLENRFQASRSLWQKAQAEAVPAQKIRDGVQAKLDEFGSKQDLAKDQLASISSRLSQIETQKPILMEAKQASEKTVAAIPGDKTLEAALKTFVDRLAEIDAEQKKLSDDHAKKSVERRTAEENFAAFRIQARAADESLQPLLKAVNDHEQVCLDLRKAMDAATQNIHSLKNEIYWEETRHSFLDGLKRQESLNFQIAQIEPMILQAREDLQNTIKESADVAERMKSVTQQFSEITVQSDTNSQRLRQTGEASKALQRALAEFQLASGLLSGMTDLAEIQSRIQEKHHQILSQVTQLQSSQAELIKKRDEVKARLTEIESQQQAIVARKTISETRMASLGESEQKYRKELAEILPELERHRENLIRTATERFHLASLKPLGPESFAWSIMKTTGVYDNYWRTEEAALEKAKPATEDQKKNPAWQIERSYEIEAAVYGKLKGYPNHFITLYGTGAGQPQSDFFATADQALYVANGGAVASWCMPSSGNPADSMLKAENPKQAAEALYLGVLGRLPDEEETASVAQILTTANEKNRQTIARDLVWALITSPEYRFNH